ncbi:MAG TPA: 2,3-bisphosphoglycerate-independent phosphoglycerate mutase [Patescibacteria group bacterium]|nr:2,3-bisphosphoglycerate-independent phosphoglycerate mutase [Patescibacteria group bacterium]
MANHKLIRQLARESGGKIILLVLDGLGGMPFEDYDETALEIANTPVMDRLAREGCLGLSHPIARGVTPGSGPAHLSLFGYDPVQTPVGRGVLSALGIGFDLQSGDIAARGNFCTVDSSGKIVDRRAGRIDSDVSLPLVSKLDKIKIAGAETYVRLVKEYRFMLALRADGLDGRLDDTDPQAIGKAPLPVTALDPAAEKSASLVQTWINAAQIVLKDEQPANMITMRGFGQDPNLPKFDDLYRLRAACVAVYPMYKGVSRLVGMEVLETESHYSPEDEFKVVADNWDDFDFFFVHVKPTDSRGEDGKFLEKAQVIESVDRALPSLLDLKPDVLVITGDHSTPASLRSHSWHPVPTLMWAPDTHLPDRAQTFGEREAQVGGLGQFSAQDLMPMIMGHALRLDKFGA